MSGSLALVGMLVPGLVELPSADAHGPENGLGRWVAPILDAGPAHTPRPNIVLVVTDDQRVDELRAMPRTQRLIQRRGTTFTHALSPYPLCCPARASILTGQYAHNHGVRANVPPRGGFTKFRDRNSLPVWLQRSGYRTMMIGKYLNGYEAAGARGYVPPGWNVWDVPVAGVYNYRRWTSNLNGHLVRHRGEYNARYVGRRASALIRRTDTNDNRPFFLMVNTLAPHVGLPHESDDPRRGDALLPTPSVDATYRDSYADDPLPANPAFNERDVSDKPRYIRSRGALSRANMRELHQQRLESLRSADDAVARTVRTLRDTGELNRTVVVVVSDNGYLMGEHRLLGKVAPYEESIRIPLLIAGPGFDTGALRQQLVMIADITTTICDIAAVKPGRIQDGRSLRGLAAHPGWAAHRAIRLEAGHPLSGSPAWYDGVRTRSFVFVRYESGTRELYDLRRDPHQLVNVAEDPTYASARRTMQRYLAEMKDCRGRGCREPRPDPARPPLP